MKSILKSALVLLTLNLTACFCHTAEAQVKHVQYFDAHEIETDDKSAAKFVEIIERQTEEAQAGTIRYYEMPPDSGKFILLREGTYASVFHPRKVHGQLVSYFRAGNKHTVKSFDNGQLTLDMEWYENKKLKHSIAYTNGKPDGELKSYYPSGALKREEMYAAGKQVSGKCYAEDGKEIAFVPFRVLPQFPGGEQAMEAFIAQNVRYPAKSQHQKESGTVIVSFIVKADGSIDKFNVSQSISEGLDNEALRVARKMPKWKPGEMEGEKVAVLYHMPFKFTLR